MAVRRNLLTGLAILGALCIGFLIGINVNYPRIEKSDAAGTIGKAVKYRNPTMTARDIELRSDLAKDTVKLKEMIRDMTVFSMITEQVGKSIDISVMRFREQGMGATSVEAEQMKLMLDYSEYIRNNNQTLNSTIALLTGIYTGDSTDQTVDLEKNLKDFGAYMSGLQAKNATLNEALVSMDHFMLSGKILKTHQAEIAKLKSVRDQLVINALQIYGILGSKEQVGILMNTTLASEHELNVIIMGTEKAGVIIWGNEKLNILVGSQQFNSTAASEMGVIIWSNQNLASTSMNSAVVYDKEMCRWIIFDRDNLGRLLANDNMQILCLMGSDKLNILFSEFSPERITQSMAYNLALHANMFNAGFTASCNNFTGMQAINALMRHEL